MHSAELRERFYYDGLQMCALRYEAMANVHDPVLYNFIVGEFEQGIINKLPLMKLNRWLGYIQGVLITRGVTTVALERDWTRPVFRHLDFEDTHD